MKGAYLFRIQIYIKIHIAPILNRTELIRSCKVRLQYGFKIQLIIEIKKQLPYLYKLSKPEHTILHEM